VYGAVASVHIKANGTGERVGISIS
jgi:hypothetical protein